MNQHPYTVEVDNENDARAGYSVMWKGDCMADQLSKADAEHLCSNITTKPLTLEQLHDVLFYQMGWEPVDVGAFMLTCKKLGFTQQVEA